MKIANYKGLVSCTIYKDELAYVKSSKIFMDLRQKINSDEISDESDSGNNLIKIKKGSI